jgi:hypothetical protein
MATKQALNQHKAIAMGVKPAFKGGGAVPFLKSGKKDTPLEAAKRANGIPGFKKGGKC